MKTQTKKRKKQITLEQFNKEKGIATITSFKVIDNTPKHTKGDWMAHFSNKKSATIYFEPKATAQILNLEGHAGHDFQANVNRIVKAVNMHDELIKMLSEIQENIKNSEEWWMNSPNRGGFDLDKIEQLLKQAEGK